MNELIPTEAQEQEWFFEWLGYQSMCFPELRLCFHIPNGGSRNAIEASHLKRQGVKPGVPDICLAVARQGFHGLYIELKRQKGGRLSAAQKVVINDLRKQGFRVEVCYGWREAAQTVLNYMGVKE